MDTAISEDGVKSFGKSIKAAIKKQKGSNSFKEIKEIKQKLSSSGIETWLVTFGCANLKLIRERGLC